MRKIFTAFGFLILSTNYLGEAAEEPLILKVTPQTAIASFYQPTTIKIDITVERHSDNRKYILEIWDLEFEGGIPVRRSENQINGEFAKKIIPSIYWEFYPGEYVIRVILIRIGNREIIKLQKITVAGS